MLARESGNLAYKDAGGISESSSAGNSNSTEDGVSETEVQPAGEFEALLHRNNPQPEWFQKPPKVARGQKTVSWAYDYCRIMTPAHPQYSDDLNVQCLVEMV